MVLNRRRQFFGPCLAAVIWATCFGLPTRAEEPAATQPRMAAMPPVMQKIEAANTSIELTVNTSRILTMDGPIPKAQVANPDLLDFTALAENQVLIRGKKSGITSVNLWDSSNNIHTVNVVVSGDVRELDRLLRLQFPTASIKLFPTAGSTLLLFGYVDQPAYVNRIVRIAEDYFPKVINNMTVGGSQQVLLHVKVMQVSRTKLRNLGVDIMGFSGANYGGSVVTGLITKVSPTTNLLRNASSFTTNSAETMQFGLISGPNGVVGMIEALKQDDILKVLAEPVLATVSGRPASCNVGGEVAYPQPTGFGNISVAFRKFGTQIDFVPIVLGNGSCRLEVRPRISEVDYTLGTTINGTSVPGFRVREADTGVELKFGQTLAIAGLLSQETQVQIKGIPGLMDVPYLGTLFRRTHSQVNEIELLILVQPDLVEGLDPDQVPPCRPGANSLSPVDCEQYFKAYREVPIPPPGGVAGSPLPGPAPADVEPILPPQPTPAIQSVPTTKAPSRGPTALLADESPQPPRPPRIRRPVASPAPAEGETQGDSYNRAGPQAPKAPVQSNPVSAPPGFIGPIGYDVRN